ncbi:MAG: hypothetical protein JWO80_3783 [Bryobacterales bacterium]|nr:hypothetical protein [Bryobacterales bacterium]
MRFVACAVVACALQAAGIPELKNEPNLERRARMAIANAESALSEAKAAYAKGDLKAAASDLEEMEKSIEIAQASLTETGKDARKRSKPFKYGEGKTREMLRHIDALENSMDIDDRKIIDGPKAKVQQVHDAWLLGIMGDKGSDK